MAAPAAPSFRPLIAFIGLACGITWALWLPRIASINGWITLDVPDWWHYTGAAGPVTAAIIILSLSEGREGIRHLGRQFVPTRIGITYLLAGVASLLALFATALIAHRIVQGAWPPLADLAKTSNLPALGLPLTFVVHWITFGIGEEAGWRGYALPRLQARFTALRATLLLSMPWLAWHFPSFFENDSFREMGLLMIVGWAVGLMLGAIFLTWLYNSSRGSLLAVVTWHALFNTLVASEAAAEVIAPVITTGIMVLALVGLALAGPRQLTGLSKQAGTRIQRISPGSVRTPT